MPTLSLGANEGIEAAFENPHHARWIDETTLTVLDNGEGETATLRLLEIEVDEEAGHAQITRSLETQDYCPVQSSGYIAEDGTAIVACTQSSTLFEFGVDGAFGRVATPQCVEAGALPRAQLVRATPVDLSLTPPAGFLNAP